ncbi:MAG: hypothetical protein JRN20_01550 [Nitrososphaerota archaeon]|nr:hypothetical protein [Nitrososphaerota archaeon]
MVESSGDETLVTASSLEYSIMEKGGLSTPHFPRYDDIKDGDKILLAAATEYDSDVIEAYASALRKKGATVDILFVELGRLGSSGEEVASKEAETLVVGDDNPAYTRFCNVISGVAARALVAAEHYKLIVAGTAGPIPAGIPSKWKRIMYISQEEIASSQALFPMELQVAIDKCVYRQIRSIEKGRLVDPEGTDITWTNYDDSRIMKLSHEMGKPVNIGFGGRADCTGVVAGTLNHMGAFPHLKAHLKDDLVVKVDGGGKYGEAWKTKMEELNNIEFPPVPVAISDRVGEKYKLPGPGFFWYWEMAIGTVPGVFRLRKEGKFQTFANFLHDRRRSGYVHNGFGGTSGAQDVLTKAGIPWTHVHVHCMFPTLSGISAEGERVTVIDKGHLTALDDREVRKVAAKYGDPDVLLREEWIPAVPGINVKGDYWRDYALDPSKWISEESNRLPEI